MSFTTIRTADQEDQARLLAAAKRFVARHPLAYVTISGGSESLDGMRGEAAALVVANECYYHDSNAIYERPLLPLWRAAARRALQHPRADQIAYGYVGYSVK